MENFPLFFDLLFSSCANHGLFSTVIILCLLPSFQSLYNVLEFNGPLSNFHMIFNVDLKKSNLLYSFLLHEIIDMYNCSLKVLYDESIKMYFNMRIDYIYPIYYI